PSLTWLSRVKSGVDRAARTPMITTTTISSTRVNPREPARRARAALRNRRQSEGVRMEITLDIDGCPDEVEAGSRPAVGDADRVASEPEGQAERGGGRGGAG